MSHLEEHFALQLRASGLPVPVREYRFHPSRRWRFDFAWPDERLAVEIEGGIWNRGRHGRGSGIAGDIEKGNAAVVEGWRVIRATSEMVMSGEALKILEGLLGG